MEEIIILFSIIKGNYSTIFPKVLLTKSENWLTLLCSQKASLNVRIKAFWYTKHYCEQFVYCKELDYYLQVDLFKPLGGYNQGFGTVTFKMADPDLLDTDQPENNSKYQSGKFINNAFRNRILQLQIDLYQN